MIERRNGTYGAVKYTEASCVVLEQLMKIWGIPNPLSAEKFHTTLIYSRKPIATSDYRSMDAEELKKLGWVFTPKAFELFPSSPETPEKKVLVMTLVAPELIKLHDELINAGAIHDFDDYIPHITLSYDVPAGFDVNFRRPGLVYLQPEKIYFEPLNLNWKEE